MTISQVKEFIKKVNEKELHTPVMLIGPTGIGKSYSIKQVAEELSINYIDLRPAVQESTDLIGIPKTITYGEAFKTTWAKPEWWPEENTKGILALEEVNRAPEDIKQALFQLVTEWKLHTHILPKGWSIVALINPDNGKYHVSPLDPAFKRRFVQVIVEPNLEDYLQDWVIWAKKNSIDENVLNYVQAYPKDLFISENIQIDAKPTPAGYEMLSTLLKESVIPTDCEHEVAVGILGTEIGTKFVRTKKAGFEKYIKGSEVLDSYEEIRDKYKEVKRQDLLYMTMLDVVAELEMLKGKLSKKQASNLKDYLLDSNPELRITVLTRIVKNNNKVIFQLSNFDDLIEDIVKIREQLQ